MTAAPELQADDEPDFTDLDYRAEFERRAKRLNWIRRNPEKIPKLKAYYAEHPWDFISDWGMTLDPRNLENNKLAAMPFILWKRQREYLEWVHTRWRASERGLAEKSRDCGVTWLSVGYAACMFCCRPGFISGFGSRKGELVDKLGDDKSIFEKLRFFLDHIPEEFLPPGYHPRKTSAYMRVWCDNGSAIVGEAGNEIGRGGRTSIYFVDEAAFIEQQAMVDRALSATTNCQMDISTVNGPGNKFKEKRDKFFGSDQLFVFDWRDDPRKDLAWYEKMKREHDEVTVAQEIDRDYNAATEGVFLPAKWVAACIDAHKRLGFTPSGLRKSGFDPADTGDAKALVNMHGSVILGAEIKNDGDISDAIPWAFEEADLFRADILRYDGDGMGTPAMRMAFKQQSAGRMLVMAYHGSDDVENPDMIYGATEDDDVRNQDTSIGRTNKDKFVNYRAQSWTWFRDRCKKTYDAIQRLEAGLLINVDPADLISIDSNCTELQQLQAELSTPKRIYQENTGKVKVESKAAMKKRGVKSPNLADAAIIAAATIRPPEKRKFNFRLPKRKMTDPGVGY